MTPRPFWRSLGMPFYVALALLVIIVGLFVVAFLSYENAPTPGGGSRAQLEERAAALLANGNPDNGLQLINTYQCATCHLAGAANGLAPSFVGLGERAGERKAELSAAAYVYESIVDPTAYLAPHFPQSMPQDYAARLSDAELGDIMAFLLTQ